MNLSDIEKAEQMKKHLAASRSPQNAQESIPDASAIAPNNQAPILDKTAQVREYLTKQHANLGDTQAIQAAQQNAKRQNNVANIGQALEQIFTANGVAHGGRPVDSSFYDNIRNQGQQGVTNAQNNHKMEIDKFTQGLDINRRVIGEMMQVGTFEQKQKAAQLAQAMNDGTSPVSVQAVQAARRTFAEVPEIANIIQDGMSANQVESALKGVKVKAAMQGRHDLMDERNLEKQMNVLRSGNPQKLPPTSGVGRAVSKINSGINLMTYAHVTPKDLADASKTPAKKAELVKKFDNLTREQYAEIVAGLMFQVSPGAGSLGMFEHLRQQTMEETKAHLMGWWESKPMPAHIGDVIFNNMNTLNNEILTNEQVVENYTEGLGIANQKLLGSEKHKEEAAELLGHYKKKREPMVFEESAKIPELPADPKDLVDGKVYLKDGEKYQFKGGKFVPFGGQ